MLRHATAYAPPTTPLAKPRILDLSRSFSRADRPVATGIDRVERAYWAELARREGEVWAIVRRGKDYALLDRAAAGDLMRRLGRVWPDERRLAQAAPGLVRALRFGTATRLLRRRSTYFGSLAGLMVLLAARFGAGFEYLNVGHSNLDDIFLRQIRKAGAAPLRIKLHDMIPLDYPDLVRADTPAIFRLRSEAALSNADQIICNSAHTARRVRQYAAGLSAAPDCVVAYPGVTVPDVARKPAPGAPYFVCVGTIEPRKNHAFLFEVWQRLADQAGAGPVPKLFLVGTRGWRNEAVFRFLDSSPMMGRHIVECPHMDDAAMFPLLAGAAGLLFPSHEEGFGLPALEARAMGVPVICSPIPVFAELLQGYATLLATDDPQRWVAAIRAGFAAQAAGADRRVAAGTASQVPTWDQHFTTVFG